MKRFTEKHFSKKIFLFAAVLTCALCFAQSSKKQQKSSSSLPKGYGGVELGMSVDAVKDALKVALNNLAEKKLNGTAIYEPAHTISEYIKNNIRISFKNIT